MLQWERRWHDYRYCSCSVWALCGRLVILWYKKCPHVTILGTFNIERTLVFSLDDRMLSKPHTYTRRCWRERMIEGGLAELPLVPYSLYGEELLQPAAINGINNRVSCMPWREVPAVCPQWSLTKGPLRWCLSTPTMPSSPKHRGGLPVHMQPQCLATEQSQQRCRCDLAESVDLAMQISADPMGQQSRRYPNLHCLWPYQTPPVRSHHVTVDRRRRI